MATRKLTRLVQKIVTGTYRPDNGRTLTLRTDVSSPSTVATATESPANSGQYEATWTEQQNYGFWYVDGVKKDNWGRVWLGSVAGNENLNPYFIVSQSLGVRTSTPTDPLHVNGTTNLQGNTRVTGSMYISQDLNLARYVLDDLSIRSGKGLELWDSGNNGKFAIRNSNLNQHADFIYDYEGGSESTVMSIRSTGVHLTSIKPLTGASISVSASLVPDVTNVFDIGSSATRFRNIHLTGNISSSGTGTNYLGALTMHTGNMAVGNLTAQAKLHVSGGLYTERDTAGAGFRFYATGFGLRSGLASNISNDVIFIIGTAVEAGRFAGGTNQFHTHYSAVISGSLSVSQSIYIGGADINTAGTLSNVAYKNAANLFSTTQTISMTGADAVFKFTEDGSGESMAIGYNANNSNFVVATGTNLTTSPIIAVNYSSLNVGIKTIAPNVALDVSGSIATRRIDVASTTTIAAMSSATGFVKLTGATATTIQGIANGADGKILKVYNATGQTMTIANENGSATAANRITTMTGGDVTTTGNGFAEFIYDSGSSRWICNYVTA